MDTNRTQLVQRGASSISAQFDEPELLPVVVRLLATGEPVAVEDVAAAGGWSVAYVQAELAKHPSVERDEAGRIVGFGLTLRPTPHRFTFGGRTVYGWCASDALAFPVVLGESGVVTSTCPATGRPITVEVTPEELLRVDPPDAVVSEVRPTERVADLRADICGLGLFFGSPEAAAPWLAQHPEGRLYSVRDDFEIHRQIMKELGWAAG